MTLLQQSSRVHSTRGLFWVELTRSQLVSGTVAPGAFRPYRDRPGTRASVRQRRLRGLHADCPPRAPMAPRRNAMVGDLPPCWPAVGWTKSAHRAARSCRRLDNLVPRITAEPRSPRGRKTADWTFRPGRRSPPGRLEYRFSWTPNSTVRGMINTILRPDTQRASCRSSASASEQISFPRGSS